MIALETFFGVIRDELGRHREARRAADLTDAPDFTTFRYIRPDENLLSDILADLLDPRGTHGQGAVFLQQFLLTARMETDLSLIEASVRREETTTFLGQSRRIDFTLEIGRFGIGVENKPWAGELTDQVSDYVRNLAKKYGADRFAMVYLSGTGGAPVSLPEGERTRLELEGRFRTMPYVGDGGLLEWLGGCRKVCLAKKVRSFLDDFINYIGTQFGAGPRRGADDMEAHIVAKHALQNEENLALFFDAADAWQEVAERIIAEFLPVLMERLRSELGDGWEVGPGGEYEAVTIRKSSWPVGASLRESLRVVLANDKPFPCLVYYTVRHRAKAPSDSVADHIAAALDENCGRGKRDGGWWPYWYRYENSLTNWATSKVLLDLWRKQDALEHFTGRLLRLARAVDSGLAPPAS